VTHLSDRGRTAAAAEVTAAAAVAAAAGRADAALDDDGADLEALAAHAAPSPAPSAPTLSLANGVGDGLVEVHALRMRLGSLHRVLRHGVHGVLRLSLHGRVACGRARAGQFCRPGGEFGLWGAWLAVGRTEDALIERTTPSLIITQSSLVPLVSVVASVSTLYTHHSR
jgi:hypothetical protein